MNQLFKNIVITGFDWESCYLHDVPKRKKQVLDDLIIEVNKMGLCITPGDQLEVEVKDHSSALEFFSVESVDTENMNLTLNYAGGIS